MCRRNRKEIILKVTRESTVSMMRYRASTEDHDRKDDETSDGTKNEYQRLQVATQKMCRWRSRERRWNWDDRNDLRSKDEIKYSDIDRTARENNMVKRDNITIDETRRMVRRHKKVVRVVVSNQKREHQKQETTMQPESTRK